MQIIFYVNEYVYLLFELVHTLQILCVAWTRLNHSSEKKKKIIRTCLTIFIQVHCIFAWNDYVYKTAETIKTLDTCMSQTTVILSVI